MRLTDITPGTIKSAIEIADRALAEEARTRVAQ